MNTREQEAIGRAEALIHQIQNFEKQLEEFESGIKNISSHENAQHCIPPHMSNALLENYKKRVEALEITLFELKTVRDEMNATPGCTKMESFANNLFQKLEERLKIAKETVYNQEQSNKNMDEIRSKRNKSQSAPNLYELQLESNKHSEEVHREKVKQTDEKVKENQVSSPSFFKKTALIAGAALVAVGVLRVLGR
jgi:leucyl aminopeptidase